MTDAPSAVCFWTDANYQEIENIAKRGCPGLKWHVSQHSPGNGVILAMGAERLKQLQSSGLCHKGRTIESMRGQVIKSQNGPVLITYAPGMRHSMADAISQITWDTRLAARLATRGHMAPDIGKYEWVDDLAEFIEQIEIKFAVDCTPVDVGFDTETMGLVPFDDDKRIVTVQFSYTEGTAVVVYMLDKQGAHLRQLLVQIRWLLTTKKIKLKGANLKFDFLWTWCKWKMESDNFTMDTTVIGSMLNENRSNSLKWHIKEYSTMGGYEENFDAKYDKAHMELVPKDEPEFLTYTGGDADGVLRIANIFRKELARYRYTQRLYVKLVHPAIRAWEKVERRGIPVDVERYAQLRVEVSDYIRDGEKEMVKLMSPRLRAKLDEKIAERLGDDKAPLTPAMLGEHFFDKNYGLGLVPKMVTEKTKKPSTANEHLTKFFDEPGVKEFVNLMANVGSARKVRSTYIDGYLSHLRADGCFHPSYAFFKGDLFDKDDDDDAGTNCVTATTLFLTDRGCVTWRNIKVGDQVVAHDGRPRFVKSVFENGKKTVFEVTLENGMWLRCTAEHPVLTKDGWVWAAELKLGDEVICYGSVEQWAKIDGWPFDISSWGRVRSHHRNRILRLNKKDKWGHLKVSLFRNGAQKRGIDRQDFIVHRLVADAFVPNFDDLPEVRHKNGFAWDNTADNLDWGESQDNSDDAVGHGMMDRTRGGQAKLSWFAVAQIRLSSESSALLAEKFDVSRRLIRFVRGGKRWIEPKEDTRRFKFNVSKVVGLTYEKAEMTYAVEVEDAHSHLTNGIMSHNTGRLSARDPAWQTLIKHDVPGKPKWAKKLRSCFMASAGKVYWSKDFKQGELRVIACCANEENMIQVYTPGTELNKITKGDLHALTGSKFADLDVVTFLAMQYVQEQETFFKRFRQNGKHGNFGLVFGISPEGFQKYAWRKGVSWTLAEATKYLNDFFELYSGINKYHTTQKSFAHKNGFVISPFGRIRHLPLINSPNYAVRGHEERRAVNSPIQSCLSDMCAWAASRIEQELGDEAGLNGMIHDSLHGMVDINKAKTILPQIGQIMESLPITQEFDWEPQLSFPTDGEYGPSLGELQDESNLFKVEAA